MLIFFIYRVFVTSNQPLSFNFFFFEDFFIAFIPPVLIPYPKLWLAYMDNSNPYYIAKNTQAKDACKLAISIKMNLDSYQNTRVLKSVQNSTAVFERELSTSWNPEMQTCYQDIRSRILYYHNNIHLFRLENFNFF